MKHKSWIQPADAAAYFDVAASTIRQWISAGKLRAAKLPTGHQRILARDVVKALLEQGRPIPPELGDLGNKHILIVDRDHRAARSIAAALTRTSGCKVTVAESSEAAEGLLNGIRPDLVLLGVRPASGNGTNGACDMLILAGATDAPPGPAASHEVAFRVSEILPTPVDETTVVSRVANVLLG